MSEKGGYKEKPNNRRPGGLSLPAVTAAVILALLVSDVLYGYHDWLNETSAAYVAGSTNDAAVYMIDDEAAAEAGRVTRGTEVARYNDQKDIDGVRYDRVDIDAAGLVTEQTADEGKGPYYMKDDDLAVLWGDVVRETEVYVRTPATIYAEADGPAIASFAAKGSCLKVLGYDSLELNGCVNKYRVEYQDSDGAAQGYVYGKYMTDTQEKADAVYNDNGVYDKVKKDKFSYNLYGGKASHLDYYPYERPVMEGNEFCSDARAMYLNCAAAVSPKNYIKIIEDTDCNAVVVDIKDGVLAYKSDVAKELSPRSYKSAYASVEKYAEGIEKLRETGVYLIGRIVVFNDPLYAKDHPEDCIKYGGSSNWPSAFSRDVWEYNVRLAQEAVREFGFNEIQFDYVRFPENSYTMSKTGGAKWRNRYDEEKGQAVQNFCFYATDQIHEAGAYFSVDVFGESAYGYMTAYGQYWPGISNIVDAISAMPYTDHTGGEGAWTQPYRTMKNWGKRAKKQQDYLEHPAAARTWITGYNTPYWAPTEDYGEAELKAQIKGLKDAGLEGGFIPWNVVNSLEKYKQYKAIWNE